MKRAILIFSCLLIFFLAIYFTTVYVDKAERSDDSLGFLTTGEEGNINNILPMIYNGIAMLIGIIFGFFYNRFSELQKQNVNQINIKAEFKLLFTATAFYLALAASPVVFGIVIIASKGVSLMASLFLAFQNGFFWQNIMPKKPVSTTPQVHAD